MSINKINAKVLSEAFTEPTIEQSWSNVLYTFLQEHSENFHYIQQDPFFHNAKTLENNILKDLTVSEIGVVYEYSLSYYNNTSRKNNGQFFTPDDVAKLLSSKIDKFHPGIWLDPCCGVGNLAWHLVNLQKDKENFLKNSMILSDLDPLALFIARVFMTVSFQKDNPNLFNDIRENFIQHDFIAEPYTETMTTKISKHYDYIIANPPYVSNFRRTGFETEKCSDAYAYFLENICKSSKGFITITPQSFTHATRFSSLRKILLNSSKSLTIYNFDNIPNNIFSGIKFGSTNTNMVNSIRPSIIVAVESSEPEYSITSLLRWRTAQRQQLFDTVDSYLSNVELTEKVFPKVSPNLEELYKQVYKNDSLESLLCAPITDYKLIVPTSPRYFISALKNDVSRSSKTTLYFNNVNDMNYAYILLNSSFMYWWWRVMDGGMTLSSETLRTLPLLDFTINDKLVEKLEKSEQDNKVTKLNAGKIQENVKHPVELLEELNMCVCPDFSTELLSVHNNSVISDNS